MRGKNDLLENFIAFNERNKLAGRHKRVLLAISGGMDSVVLADLLQRAGYTFGIAHCNFGLRGDESDGDEQLVRSLAEQYKVPGYFKRFDTEVYATEHKLSIQVAARELRYAWFEQVRRENKFDFIATAHHLNDNIETILYNFIKGTGIRGLRGILPKQQKIIRPLLFATREQIAAWQQEHKLIYREDSSNASDKYTRNKLRLQVLPLLKEINPALEETIGTRVELLHLVEDLYDKQIARQHKRLFLKRGNDIYIPLALLEKTTGAEHALFEYLKAYGFNATQVKELMESTAATPGKQWLAAQGRIIKDRRFYILSAYPAKQQSVLALQEGDTELHTEGLQLQVERKPNAEVQITADKNTVYLNADKLSFPLLLRRWKQGDYFYPFGMGMKKKKLKKFFTDQKIALHEKEQCWVMESDKKIVWLVGQRSDERFKVTPATKEVLVVKLLNKKQ